MHQCPTHACVGKLGSMCGVELCVYLVRHARHHMAMKYLPLILTLSILSGMYIGICRAASDIQPPHFPAFPASFTCEIRGC